MSQSEKGQKRQESQTPEVATDDRFPLSKDPSQMNRYKPGIPYNRPAQLGETFGGQRHTRSKRNWSPT